MSETTISQGKAKLATPLRLVIAEDNPSDVELMLSALRHAGYEPTAERVETEQEYREKLQSLPEIVLSDFSMPEFDALRALEIMMECQLDIPVIIVSGSIGEERAVEIMRRGASDYIIKDRMGRLGHAVSRALEQKRLREANQRAEKALSENEAQSRKIQDEKEREEEASRRARELTVAVNEALLISSVRQHELTEAAETLNAQLQVEITARQKAARELLEKARLLDLSNDAIIVNDLDDRIRLWNKGAEKLYGWTREEAIEKQLHILLHTEFSIPHEQIVAQLHREGQYRGEVVQTTREGRRVPALCRKVLDVDTKSVLTSYTDISEHKRFEGEREAHLVKEQALRQEAEMANRSKDLFLATLSHEVRTPLNAILGWASILRSGKCDAAEMEEGMEVIERNCHAQAKLIEEVLDVSRIVTGKLNLQLRKCDLVDVILAAVDVVKPGAETKGVRIEVKLERAASLASCDKDRMQQVIWNLLTNAVKFTPGGKTVRISLRGDASEAVIEVRDEGIGMDADFLPFVFDRFRQAEGVAHRKFGGLGLGLSIVKHVVELHGGTVVAESAGAGQGSTFTVKLPVRAAQVNDVDELTDRDGILGMGLELNPVRLDGLRVLVVDDEADARRLLAKVLGEAGAEVTAAGSVGEALRLAETAHPQVLLSDIGMVGQDGYDLIRQLRAAGYSAKELPAMAVTAYAHEQDRIRVLSAGFQEHVPKPVDPHTLIAVLARLAGRTR